MNLQHTQIALTGTMSRYSSPNRLLSEEGLDICFFWFTHVLIPNSNYAVVLRS